MHRSPPTFSLDDKIEALKSSAAAASLTTTPASKALDDLLKSSSQDDDSLRVVNSSNKRLKKKQDDTPQTSLVSLVQNSTKFDMTELFHAATSEEPGKKAFDFPPISWTLEEEVSEDNSSDPENNEGLPQVKSVLKGLIGGRHQEKEEEEEGSPFHFSSAAAFSLGDSTTGSRRVKSTSCLLGKRKLSGLVRSKTLRHGVDHLLDCTSN